MLTFIAEYPDDGNIRDGMMLRIHEIDAIHAHIQRTYLEISFFRSPKNKGVSKVYSNKLTVHYLNFFLDFFKIYHYLKQSKIIYAQTLYNYVKVLPFIQFLLTKTPVVLDLHGVIPEEIAYQHRPLVAAFYQWVENLAFKRANFFMHVTHAMRNQFALKFPAPKRNKWNTDLVLGIFTSYQTRVEENKLAAVKKELNWDSSQVWFLYSGGAQEWQNISMMLDYISGLENPNYRFLFLSGQASAISSQISQRGLSNKITLLSVSPAELPAYYTLCHYGFVLRHSSLVNKVANPTKLSEYLAFGLIPVVLEPAIGDYLELDFEFVKVSELNNQLLARKSTKNIDIYRGYIHEMEASAKSLLPLWAKFLN